MTTDARDHSLVWGADAKRRCSVPWKQLRGKRLASRRKVGGTPSGRRRLGSPHLSGHSDFP